MSSIGQQHLEGKDPVHAYEGRWYFWDETWSARIGPYDSYHEAEEALYLYVEKRL